MSWKVDFYLDEAGVAPVEHFLIHLPQQQRAKLIALIRLLEQAGPSLPFPYSSQIRGKLRELRTQHGKDRFRIFYFADLTRTFILLHATIKRTAKTSEEDISIAEKRMVLHILRKGKERR